ncbi:hypothetical protein ACOME3_000763 [Neoechinorhynchus agilis]
MRKLIHFSPLKMSRDLEVIQKLMMHVENEGNLNKFLGPYTTTADSKARQMLLMIWKFQKDKYSILLARVVHFLIHDYIRDQQRFQGGACLELNIVSKVLVDAIAFANDSCCCKILSEVSFIKSLVNHKFMAQCDYEKAVKFLFNSGNLCPQLNPKTLDPLVCVLITNECLDRDMVTSAKFFQSQTPLDIPLYQRNQERIQLLDGKATLLTMANMSSFGMFEAIISQAMSLVHLKVLLLQFLPEAKLTPYQNYLVKLFLGTLDNDSVEDCSDLCVHQLRMMAWGSRFSSKKGEMRVKIIEAYKNSMKFSHEPLSLLGFIALDDVFIDQSDRQILLRRAYDMFSKALKRNPNSLIAQMGMARTLAQTSHYQEAVKILNEVLNRGAELCRDWFKMDKNISQDDRNAANISALLNPQCHLRAERKLILDLENATDHNRVSLTQILYDSARSCDLCQRRYLVELRRAKEFQVAINVCDQIDSLYGPSNLTRFNRAHCTYRKVVLMLQSNYNLDRIELMLKEVIIGDVNSLPLLNANILVLTVLYRLSKKSTYREKLLETIEKVESVLNECSESSSAIYTSIARAYLELKDYNKALMACFLSLNYSSKNYASWYLLAVIEKQRKQNPCNRLIIYALNQCFRLNYRQRACLFGYAHFNSLRDKYPRIRDLFARYAKMFVRSDMALIIGDNDFNDSLEKIEHILSKNKEIYPANVSNRLNIPFYALYSIKYIRSITESVKRSLYLGTDIGDVAKSPRFKLALKAVNSYGYFFDDTGEIWNFIRGIYQEIQNNLELALQIYKKHFDDSILCALGVLRVNMRSGYYEEFLVGCKQVLVNYPDEHSAVVPVLAMGLVEMGLFRHAASVLLSSKIVNDPEFVRQKNILLEFLLKRMYKVI